MLKNLVKDLKPSSTLLINETSRKLEEQGKNIYKFGFGQSPFKVPEDVVEELFHNIFRNLKWRLSKTKFIYIFSLLFQFSRSFIYQQS